MICIGCQNISTLDITYGGILYFLVPCHLFVAYIIEYVAAQQSRAIIARAKRQGEEKSSAKNDHSGALHSIKTMWLLVALAHGINACLNLFIATWVVYYHIHHPVIGTSCELHAVIVWLKTCSYALTNRDLRHALLHPDGGDVVPELYRSCPYPQNITLRNLCYFWWAPTLVYQPVYPRTTSIRWTFVLKRVIEMVVLVIAIWVAIAQYAAPLLENSIGGISNLDLPTIIERLMKLSTISVFCWLAGFFALFQSFLNCLAEVMRFGDREFYGDWWNSSSIKEYWASWNKPVFQFMKRHVYSPMVARGVSPKVAQVVTFLFSGIFHELLVGVPTHNIIGVAFAGMMFQLPLIFMTEPLKKMKGIDGKLIGNIVFWVSFCLVGQPLAVLLYFFAWQAKYGSTGPLAWSSNSKIS